jgi:D-arabinose 1-dehydrogenase-like Zn-dependent alcohol dehydrogenase
MDPYPDGKVMNRVLATTGNGSFFEQEYNVPSIGENEITVKAVMTGVCRSDIDMMSGDFGPLPLHMQGHEGLGTVVAIGSNITNVKVGDFVATRGEPAYADYYNVRAQEYVRVPELQPKYILEPVACGINIIQQPLNELTHRQGPGKKLAILGSGFLAWVAFNTIKLLHLDFKIEVIGSNNRDLWKDKLLLDSSNTYDVVIDLSGKYILDTMLNNNSLIIDGVGKAVSREEAQSQLWKACTTVRPSPRTHGFYRCMLDAEYWITNNDIVVDSLWTKGYNRTSEWQQAFDDGKTRPAEYSRGYIYWI